MNAGARLIVGIVGLILIIVGIFSAMLYMNFIDVAGTALQGFAGQEEAALVGLVLLVLGLILVGTSLRGVSSGEGGKQQSIALYNQNGEINISFQAVENMALRVSREIHGIRDTSTKVKYTDEGLTIVLKVKVLPDMEIPPLSSDLQQKVKEYVEEKTGTPVNEVRITVENIVVDHMVTKQRS